MEINDIVPPGNDLKICIFVVQIFISDPYDNRQYQYNYEIYTVHQLCFNKADDKPWAISQYTCI